MAEALPPREPMTVAGEEIDVWRDAFRVLQAFEIQSTLLPFLAVQLEPLLAT
jgi:hypothetical protein